MTNQDKIKALKDTANTAKAQMQAIRRASALQRFAETTTKLASKYGADALLSAFNSGVEASKEDTAAAE